DLVSAGSIIDTWTRHDWRDGLCVDRLMPHDRIAVHTKHSLYEFIVTDPASAEVMVGGGSFFPQFTRVRVAGGYLGGSFLEVNGIYNGFRIELLADAQMIITSPVESIDIMRGDLQPKRVM